VALAGEKMDVVFTGQGPHSLEQGSSLTVGGNANVSSVLTVHGNATFQSTIFVLSGVFLIQSPAIAAGINLNNVIVYAAVFRADSPVNVNSRLTLLDGSTLDGSGDITVTAGATLTWGGKNSFLQGSGTLVLGNQATFLINGDYSQPGTNSFWTQRPVTSNGNIIWQGQGFITTAAGASIYNDAGGVITALTPGGFTGNNFGAVTSIGIINFNHGLQYPLTNFQLAFFMQQNGKLFVSAASTVVLSSGCNMLAVTNMDVASQMILNSAVNNVFLGSSQLLGLGSITMTPYQANENNPTTTVFAGALFTVQALYIFGNFETNPASVVNITQSLTIDVTAYLNIGGTVNVLPGAGFTVASTDAQLTGLGSLVLWQGSNSQVNNMGASA